MNNRKNRRIIEEFEYLFENSTPSEMRRNMQYIFFDFLINLETNLIPNNFEKIIQDFNTLFEYMDKAEDITNHKED